ncbi:DsbA family oxidoreductase [Nocardioides jiangxiensis]|uniref:DsbA family oxidoreductase n=1 Tax=Nocardioides jiangxiensis TaxID=3064524 RepID=A0ABT9B736_9ACTN|nr:DsbA family oxidoreductase [Nocardioides sp. WY-20]MDO7869116.1 DsbA family oxidoreductase [Nocardioides sp. WY-20]
MEIEIWSDVVCPWCYIGKRRLEKALDGFEHDVTITWRSFQLDPGAPTVPVETVAEALGRKYGGGEAAGRQMIDRVEAVAAEEGMLWRHHQSQRVGTVDAHRLLHLALHDGGPKLQGQLKERLFAAYFAEAANVADHGVLRSLAAEAGLDAARVDEVLAGSDYLDEVYADQQQAGAYGATGVPFYVIEKRYGVSGAQPAEALRQVLGRAWTDLHPSLTIVDGDNACGPDGCAI